MARFTVEIFVSAESLLREPINLGSPKEKLMKNKPISSRIANRRRQAGLTLIELLIVLVVLVGVAGILVPLFPDVRQRTHGATGADNMKETSKALQLHLLNTGGYPNELDALIDEAGVLAIEAATTPQFATTDLDDSSTDLTQIRAALNGAGIETLLVHDSTTENATFEPYSGDIEDLTGATASVVTLTTAGINALGLEALSADGTIAYVLAGVGAGSSAIGESMLDAPVHFAEEHSPIDEYSRFLAVFAVPAEGALRLAGVVANHEGELDGLGNALNEYYEATE